jgi:hypothetical protein
MGFLGNSGKGRVPGDHRGVQAWYKQAKFNIPGGKYGFY